MGSMALYPTEVSPRLKLHPHLDWLQAELSHGGCTCSWWSQSKDSFYSGLKGKAHKGTTIQKWGVLQKLLKTVVACSVPPRGKAVFGQMAKLLTAQKLWWQCIFFHKTWPQLFSCKMFSSIWSRSVVCVVVRSLSLRLFCWAKFNLFNTCKEVYSDKQASVWKCHCLFSGFLENTYGEWSPKPRWKWGWN